MFWLSHLALKKICQQVVYDYFFWIKRIGLFVDLMLSLAIALTLFGAKLCYGLEPTLEPATTITPQQQAELIRYLNELPGAQGDRSSPSSNREVSCLTGKSRELRFDRPSGLKLESEQKDPACNATELSNQLLLLVTLASEVDQMDGKTPEEKKGIFEEKFIERFGASQGLSADILKALPQFLEATKNQKEAQEDVDSVAVRDRVFTKLKDYAVWAEYFERIEKGDQAALCYMTAEKLKEEKDPQVRAGLLEARNNLRDRVQTPTKNKVKGLIGIAYGSGGTGGDAISRSIPKEFKQEYVTELDRTLTWYQKTKNPNYTNDYSARDGDRFVTDWATGSPKYVNAITELDYRSLLSSEEYQWFQTKFENFHKKQVSKFQKIHDEFIVPRLAVTQAYNNASGQIIGEIWVTAATGAALKPFLLAWEASTAVRAGKGLGMIEAGKALSAANKAKGLLALRSESALQFITKGAFRAVQVGVGGAAYNGVTHLINDQFGQEGEFCNLVNSLKENGSPFDAAKVGAIMGATFYGLGGPFANPLVQSVASALKNTGLAVVVSKAGVEAVEHANQVNEDIQKGEYKKATGGFLHLANLLGVSSWGVGKLAKPNVVRVAETEKKVKPALVMTKSAVVNEGSKVVEVAKISKTAGRALSREEKIAKSLEKFATVRERNKEKNRERKDQQKAAKRAGSLAHSAPVITKAGVPLKLAHNMANHTENLDGAITANKGVKGCHSKICFDKLIREGRVNLERPHPNISTGVYTVQYTVVAGGQMFKKTLYDPGQLSSAQIIELGEKAAIKGYTASARETTKGYGPGRQTYRTQIEGPNGKPLFFQTYLNAEGQVTNYHLITPP